MATTTHSQCLGVITYATGYFVEILDISLSGVGKADIIDVTHMGVAATSGTLGNKIYIESFYVDAGEADIEIQFNPDTTPPKGFQACTIAWGNSTTKATWAGSACLSDMSIKAPLDGSVMKATCKLKFSGAITIVPGT